MKNCEDYDTMRYIDCGKKKKIPRKNKFWESIGIDIFPGEIKPGRPTGYLDLDKFFPGKIKPGKAMKRRISYHRE